jgi:30S ribosomal protein S31
MGPAIAHTWRCSLLESEGLNWSVRGIWTIVPDKIFPVSNRRREMGKGDRRTRKGKIYRGSYGKTRPGRPAKKKPAPKR